MKKLFKYIGYLILSGLAFVSLYMANLFLMKPHSLDHYLAKELTMSLLDSPEFMTYLGIFDPYNAILKHNQKLSIDTLEDGEKDHLDNIKHLSMLKKYNPDNLCFIKDRKTITEEEEDEKTLDIITHDIKYIDNEEVKDKKKIQIYEKNKF